METTTDLCALVLLRLAILSAEPDEAALSLLGVLGDAESKRLGSGGSVKGHRDGRDGRRVAQAAIVIGAAARVHELGGWDVVPSYGSGRVGAPLQTASVAHATGRLRVDDGGASSRRRRRRCAGFLERLVMRRRAFLMIVAPASRSQQISKS